MSSAPQFAGSPASPATPALPPPPDLTGRFGRYEIVRLLGRGGMGAVYLAKQTDLDRQVVIKVIVGGDDQESIARFQREAKTAAKVTSDHVVQVHETGTENGIPYIAMEYVDGSSAAELIERRGRFPWIEATQIVTAAARGLAAAHAKNVLHRDVKPANILVAKDGRVKIADFGLAKPIPRDAIASDPALTKSGFIIGSPFYMAPEQAEGKALDPRADVYALGATYFELLTGKPPFPGTSPVKVLSLVLTAPTPSPRDLVPSLPRSVERACLRLIARDRDKRPASMEETIQLLERVSLTASTLNSSLAPPIDDDRPPAWARPGPPKASPAPSGGQGRQVFQMVVALVVLIGLGWLGVNRIRAYEPPPKKPRPTPPAPVVIVPSGPDAPPPPPEPLSPEAARKVELQTLYDRCGERLAAGDTAGAERCATDTLEHLAGDERVERARFLVARGVARIFQERFADADRDLDDAVSLDPESEHAARFVSFCGALLAKDERVAERRERELPADSLWSKVAEEIRVAGASRKRPERDFLPFPHPVLNTAYARTVERLLLRPR